MAASKPNQTPSDFEEYIRDLLECPVCMEIIKSVPVYQCANGHVICMDCIEQLHNCPICRNDSELRRNLKLENIVQRLEGIQYENEETTTAKPNLQKWGKGSVRVYGTIDGPNQELLIRSERNRDVLLVPELQTNSEHLNTQQSLNPVWRLTCAENMILVIYTLFSLCCAFLLIYFFMHINGTL